MDCIFKVFLTYTTETNSWKYKIKRLKIRRDSMEYVTLYLYDLSLNNCYIFTLGSSVK